MLTQRTTSIFWAALFFSLFTVFTQPALAGPSFEQRLISEVGWSVTLIDVIYDPLTNSTTFTYELDAALDEKDLSHWVLSVDVDETGLTSVSPDILTSVGLDPTTGVWGIKWDAGQDSGTSMIYTITVPGEVDVIDIDYAVKGGTYFAIGTTQGPGSDGSTPNTLSYSISGNIFVDANLNMVFDMDEPLLNSVTIALHDLEGNLITTTLSDANGNYLFDNLLPADYVIVIPETSINDDFNNLLFTYMSAHMGTSLMVSVIDMDVLDVDFGFTMNTTNILNDFNGDDLDGNGFTFPGEGRTIGYWKHQLAVAIKGKGRAHVDAATMMTHLSWIESYLLIQPFQFTDNMEFVHAHSIMANRTNIAVELMLKQLLATELNHVSGLGMTGNYIALQHVILAWSEYLAANHTLYSRDDLLMAKDILDSINNMGH
jgi:hypothetical protein